MKLRTPEISFYEWYVSRWLTSMTRITNDPATRGVYRDLLDVCYKDGFIPADLGGLAAVAMCPVEEMERIWPKIKRHFSVDRHDSTKLRNSRADVYRNEYFSYVKKQRARRKQKIAEEEAKSGKDKSNDDKRVRKLAPSKPQASSGLAGDITRQDKTIQDETTRHDTKNLRADMCVTVPGKDPPKTWRTYDEMTFRDLLRAESGFGEFWAIAESVGMPGSDMDRHWAEIEWGRLDFEQRILAVNGIRDRAQLGITDDGICKSLPQNYLRDHKWQRKIQARSSTSITSSKADDARAILARREKANGQI